MQAQMVPKEPPLNVIGREGESVETANGERLIEFCIRNGLKIANTFFKHKPVHKWTRVSEERNERSIIDYVIVTNSLFYSTQDVRVMRGAEIYSDHFLVIAKLNILPKQKSQKSKISKRSKLKVEEFKSPIVKAAYQNSIKSKLDKQPQTDEVETLWIRYKETLKESANEVCGRKILGGNKKRTAWWNEVVKSKIKEKKIAWKKYLASKSKDDFESYKTKRNAAKEVVRKSKQNEWEKFGEKLETDFRDNQKLFWGAMKRCRRGNSSTARHIKNSNGEIVKNEEKILETWKEHFQNLHNSNNENNDIGDETCISNLEEDVDETMNITMTELVKAKKKIKTGKAPGADEIYPEMVVNQGLEADKLLLKICQIAWKTHTLPEDWNKSTIIPIHKNGSTLKCENYRGISLLSVPGKVYARILEERLRRVVEDQLLEYQSGFRPGRSVQDHIYTLRQTSENIIRYNAEAHICFIDLQKAFDSVNRKELWKTLEEHNVNKDLIQAIKSFYVNPQSAVQILGRSSSSFTVNIGVRQGCILSPLLFIILMNSISKQCNALKPFIVGMLKLMPVKLGMLSFADDLAVFAKTAEDLEYNVSILNRELKKKGMTINSKKTKTMVISREPKQHTINIGDEPLEQVECYKYLGVMISSNGRIKEEINQRIGKATKVYHQLGQTFINKRELKTKTKMAIYNTVYCPTLLYGSESWTLDSRDKSRLQATEMKFLRRTVGKTKRDKIRNTRIREEVKTETLEHKLERNQLRWFGHVNRMNEKQIPKKIFECKQSDKLPRGRPRKTWKDSIAEALKGKGMTFKDALKRSKHREGWRKFIHT